MYIYIYIERGREKERDLSLSLSLSLSIYIYIYICSSTTKAGGALPEGGPPGRRRGFDNRDAVGPYIYIYI